MKLPARAERRELFNDDADERDERAEAEHAGAAERGREVERPLLKRRLLVGAARVRSRGLSLVRDASAGNKEELAPAAAGVLAGRCPGTRRGAPEWR